MYACLVTIYLALTRSLSMLAALIQAWLAGYSTIGQCDAILRNNTALYNPKLLPLRISVVYNGVVADVFAGLD